jgi:hypothetical protein
MNDVDVLTELRAWRDEFARSHGYDLGAMAAVLRELDTAAGARLARGEPRRPPARLSRGPIAPDPVSELIGSAGQEPVR